MRSKIFKLTLYKTIPCFQRIKPLKNIVGKRENPGTKLPFSPLQTMFSTLYFEIQSAFSKCIQLGQILKFAIWLIS